MTPEQDRMARRFIRGLGRDDEIEIEENETGNGYDLYSRGSDRNVGFVRFNIRGENSDHYTIYTHTSDFSDPRGMFFNEHTGQPVPGWRATVYPYDEVEIRYVRRVIREIIDRS